MSLLPVKEILQIANGANTSVIAFNCINYNTIYSVIKAGEAANKPVLCMLYPEDHTMNNWISPESFVAAVTSVAAETKTPVGIHLDHCYDFNYIMRAIRAGFSSVMYDGSMLPLEENIANTKKVTEVSHAFDVMVEAELGHVGKAVDSDQRKKDMYTQPDVAADFINRSKCDALAIAIGSAHGVYKEIPHLDIDRLIEINNATDTPLVLHGGSGIPNEQLEQAFLNGINKFNVGTEFLQLYYDTMYKYCQENGVHGGAHSFATFVQPVLIDYLVKKLSLSKL